VHPLLQPCVHPPGQCTASQMPGLVHPNDEACESISARLSSMQDLRLPAALLRQQQDHPPDTAAVQQHLKDLLHRDAAVFLEVSIVVAPWGGARHPMHWCQAAFCLPACHSLHPCMSWQRKGSGPACMSRPVILVLQLHCPHCLLSVNSAMLCCSQKRSVTRFSP
jgi:hypothetical protein